MLALAMVGLALAQEGEFNSHLNQARHFAHRGWYDDAERELRAALDTLDGLDSYEAHWLYCQVAWERLDVATSLQMARLAAELAPDEGKAREAALLADSYAERFGFLHIEGPDAGMTTTLQVRHKGILFDPELKQYLKRLDEHFGDPTLLPIDVGLPAGPYEINGVELLVDPGRHDRLDLPMKAIGGRHALQLTRLELSAGVGFFAGEEGAHMFPSPQVQLSLNQPLGPIVVGLSADNPRITYQNSDVDVQVGVPAWLFGGRLGLERRLGGALLVRPSLVYRQGQLPGAGAPCDNGCSALVRLPGAELALDHQPIDRATSFSTGVRVAADRALSPQFSATGVRLLADFTLAL